MQACSQAYKEAMKQPGFRGNGYIKVYIGVINSEAQRRANVNDERNSFTYFSNLTKPFNGYEPETLYATQEQNFSHVDGSMYFLPEEGGDILFNNGLITEEILGTIYVVFQFFSRCRIFQLFRQQLDQGMFRIQLQYPLRFR